jgi:hypothetical protein
MRRATIKDERTRRYLAGPTLPEQSARGAEAWQRGEAAVSFDETMLPLLGSRKVELRELRAAPKEKETGAGAFGDSRMRSGLCFATMLAASALAAAEAPLTVDQLLAQGWEIAGYASGYDNRTSLILFRHQGTNALVQCGVLYDVTRNPRTIVNCYELK